LKGFGLSQLSVMWLYSHETPINTILNDDDGHWTLKTCWKRHFDKVLCWCWGFSVLITMMNSVAVLYNISFILELNHLSWIVLEMQWWTGLKSIRNTWWWWWWWCFVYILLLLLREICDVFYPIFTIILKYLSLFLCWY
jgi:hypothetical protein